MGIPTPANQDPARLGRYLRRQRVAHGYSYEVLARATGINKGNLYRIEQGEWAAGPHVLQALARALEVDLADLYLEAGLPLPQKLPTMRPYLRATSDLPDEAIDRIAEYVDLLTEHYQDGKEGDHDDAATAA